MNSKYPLVCICIPTYNSEKTILATLNSILSQTYYNLAIHISDNASTDDTLKIVESFCDSRIVVHQNLKNMGAEDNFNRCINLAHGKYTAIFHSDDIYEPTIVTKQVEFLESNPNVGAVFTEANLINEIGHSIGHISLPRGILSQSGVYDFKTIFKAILLHSNFLITPSFMVHTVIYSEEIKAWRGDLFGSSADLDVWLRILRNHSIAHLPERLIRYRLSNMQFSAQVRLETEPAAFFKVLDYHLQTNRVKDIINIKDISNYNELKRRDCVVRAVNLFLMDRTQEAAHLVNDVFSWQALRASLQSRRAFLTILLNSYLKFLLVFKLIKIGKKSLLFAKRTTRR